ncbi:MAG: N-acetylmuramoyl-L-alanine amidase [Candidatus Puniceispirillum sp. TMED52]|nr:N-acetylmuramoyl-L-alanine amidase [SAR116 cluster bacterium]OUU46838.1 MAG: N-acetylmuramoyl-L-alanine amidase [Candidatus Puniceispirillum sp. TMED52]HCP17661.1 N-acetylmuramoyl-L-alanine amidase [Alphaproteobacteria bacterium]
MLNPDDIRYLVVHCSDTEDDLTAADIHAMHLGFGWHGIGYHAVIVKDGTIEQGRPPYWQGAHVYGHNTESLGVCLIGRHDFTREQMDALDTLLREWRARYPNAQICGHCDFPETAKTCPNFDVAAWCQNRGIEA